MSLSLEDKKFLELITSYEVTKIVNSSQAFSEQLEDIFKAISLFLGVEDFCIYLYDKKLSFYDMLYQSKELAGKDFQDVLLNDKKIFENFFDLKMAYLSTENKYLPLDSLATGKIKKISQGVSIYIPLMKKGSVIGFIGFINPSLINQFLSVDYLMLFNILSTQISSIIINSKLDQSLLSSVIVANAVKDIAKVIETQYELEYVIPLIGEIMDKYLTDTLVYIFFYDQVKGFELSWPGSYSKKMIDPILEEIIRTPEAILSDNGYIIALPLICDNALIGVVVGDAKIQKINDKEKIFLEEMSKQCCITMKRAMLYSETVKQATVDVLTGLDNRRQVNVRFAQESSYAYRSQRPLSIMVLDIDFFKSINDTYGHSSGDSVLKEVANIIRQAKREYDIAGRYGGEEFVIMSPDTDINGAKVLAERIRYNIEMTNFKIANFVTELDKNIKITISIGISVFDGECKNPVDVLEEADIALYKAKQDGRNRVVVFNE